MKQSSRIAAALLAAGLLLLPAANLPGNSTNLDVARQLNRAFVEVAEKVMPAVVVIKVHQRPPEFSSLEGESDAPRRRSPRRFHEDLEETIGSGSGVIIRKDGYIVTNRHVVEEAERIEVRLKDGRKFPATVRGVDAQSDVAVIKIEATDLPVAQLADSSKTRVGEFAIAIGAPYQFDYSVTFGHVSAKSRDNVIPRYFGGGAYDQDYLRTDANINPGNSGGPLVNIEGEVIGINTIIRGINTGIGFAIPASLVKDVSDQLISNGKFTRAWLGVSILALDEDDRYHELIPEVKAGVVVRAIVPNGPAAKSELRASDVILAVDGKPVATPQELRNEIRGKQLGAPVRLTVHRAGKKTQVEIRPGEWVQEAESKPVAATTTTRTNTPAKLGLEVKALTTELAEKFGIKSLDAGVIVTSVEADSVAKRNGIQPGDLITAINQQPTPSPRRFQEAMKAADLQKGVVVNLTSQNSARFEILKAEEK
jgi:serine protease Do